MCWGCAGGLCHFFVFSLICQRHIKKEVNPRPTRAREHKHRSEPQGPVGGIRKGAQQFPRVRHTNLAAYPRCRLDVVGGFNSHLISGDPAPVTTAWT